MSPETTEATAAVFTAIATIVLAGAGVYGIDSWRREHFGRKRTDLAEQTLALFYEARDALSAIRSPLGWSGEGKSRKKDPDETPDQAAILDNGYVVWERYETRKDVFNRLHSMRYRFMAEIGVLEAEPFEQLRRILNRILGASKSLADLHLKATSGMRNAPDFKSLIDEEQGVMSEGYAKPDRIKLEIDNLVSDMETTCRGIIRRSEEDELRTY